MLTFKNLYVAPSYGVEHFTEKTASFFFILDIYVYICLFFFDRKYTSIIILLSYVWEVNDKTGKRKASAVIKEIKLWLAVAKNSKVIPLEPFALCERYAG